MKIQHSTVLILVFVEYGFRDNLMEKVDSFRIEVLILVFVEYGFRAAIDIPQEWIDMVLILVFVEYGFRVVHQSEKPYTINKS